MDGDGRGKGWIDIIERSLQEGLVIFNAWERWGSTRVRVNDGDSGENLQVSIRI